MRNQFSKGWNSWNPETMTSYVFIPDGIEVRFALLSEGMMIDRFTWRDHVKIVGPHSLDGRYSKVILNFHGNTVAIEFSRKNHNSILGRVKPLEVHSKNLNAIFILHNLYHSEYGSLKVLNDRMCILHGPLNACLALSESSKWGLFPSITSARAYLSLHKVLPNKICGLPYVALFQIPLEKELFFSSSCSGSPESEITEHCKSLIKEAEILLKEAAHSYEGETPKVRGLWEGVEEGIKRALAWNIIWDAKNNRMLCPVSRNWACHWGGWVLFDWDTFFTAILASLFDKELAYKIAASILDEVTEEGFVPNYSSLIGKTVDRSQPPVGSYCILKLHKLHPNYAFLREAYPKLKRWHLWWMKNRDGNGDGLLEWGTREGPIVRSPAFTDSSAGTLKAALFESGLDNSPMYDDVSLMSCENNKVMNLADVGLNALYALDAWALSNIAKELGINNDSEAFEKEYEDLKRKINDALWCEELGIYLNKYWNGVFSKVLSPTLFYPLLAGIVPPKRARRMVEEHLLNEKEFWGEYVIPSVSRNHPAFKDQEYWRGRIWAPMNYLVTEGLRRYGFYDVSYLVAEKSLRLFLREWREETHVHENYNAISGDGDDVISSEPVYTWGALLGYLPIQELIDVEVWGGLKFGTPHLEGSVSIEGYNIGGNLYDVHLSKNGLRVIENGKEIIRSNAPLLIRNYRKSEYGVEFNVIADKEKIITLEVGNLEDLSYEVKAESKIMRMKAKEGRISMQVPITSKGLNVEILRM